MTGPFYGVYGDRTVGPFHIYRHAKQALNINRSNDEIVEAGQLYRYGRAFIGTHEALVQHKVISDNKKEITPTYIRISTGVAGYSGGVRTLNVGNWQKL